jgi:Fe-S oxidoreductase
MTLLYFTGCMASYRIDSIVKSTIELLKKAGVDFKMLGDKEWCCGSVLLRTGNKELAREVAEHNIKEFKNSGIDTIVTSCAGCYKTLKLDYPELVGPNGIEVLSSPELIGKLIEDGKIKFDKSDLTVTFHDPCHMGRHSNLYDAPRDVLKSVEGLNLVEMPRNRENARCCGSGGGVQSAFKDLSHKIADTRINEAIGTGAEILTTPCPFCTYALAEASKRNGNKIKVMDFAEFVMELME